MGTWTRGTCPRSGEAKLAQIWHLMKSKDIEVMEQAPGKVITEAEMSGYRFPAYVVRDRDGWAAHCPEFPDCRACGATYEEALDNLRGVIQIFVEDGFGDDEPPPQHDQLSFTTLSL
jgi:predicted RNase H-like HicB family nuclease